MLTEKQVSTNTKNNEKTILSWQNIDIINTNLEGWLVRAEDRRVPHHVFYGVITFKHNYTSDRVGLSALWETNKEDAIQKYKEWEESDGRKHFLGNAEFININYDIIPLYKVDLSTFSSQEETQPITTSDIEEIHSQVLKEYGGLYRPISKEGRVQLQAAIGRMNSGFGEEEFYKTVIEKAAILIHSIITTHPFTDGNKRTGLASGLYFLHLNGFTLEDDNSLADLVLSLAEGVADASHLQYYIEQHKQAWNEEFDLEHHINIDTHQLLSFIN